MPSLNDLSRRQAGDVTAPWRLDGTMPACGRQVFARGAPSSVLIPLEFNQFFRINWATAFSRPSRVNSNMGKISRMALMVRV